MTTYETVIVVIGTVTLMMMMRMVMRMIMVTMVMTTMRMGVTPALRVTRVSICGLSPMVMRMVVRMR